MISIFGLDGIGEVNDGDRLATLIAAAAGGTLVEGDVLVVTQKIVSKAEGRLVPVNPEDPLSAKALVEQESVRIVRRRGDLIISETDARLRVRQRRHRLVERAGGLRRAAARRLRPLGAAHSRRAARRPRHQRRRDHLRHVRPPVAQRPHRRGHRRRRRRRGRRPARHHRRARPRAAGHRSRGRRRDRRRPPNS